MCRTRPCAIAPTETTTDIKGLQRKLKQTGVQTSLALRKDP